MEPLKIIFAVLSTYERSGWIHPSILQFFCDLPFNKGYAFRMIPVHNFIPAASGRNVLAKQIKDTEADWLCMIDNDMNLPANFLETIKEAPEDASIIVPSFYMWSQSDLKLTLCWGMDNVENGVVSKLDPGFHELTKCGTGAIFIKPKVFQALAYPYFKYLHNDDGGQVGTEDIQFCLQAREKGFKIYGNSAMRVGHWHTLDLGSLWDWYDARQKQLEKTVDFGKPAGVEVAV